MTFRAPDHLPRSYSLSGEPSAKRYRVSIKRGRLKTQPALTSKTRSVWTA